MKVKDLIAQLQAQDPDRIVVLANDPQGDNHRECTSINTGSFKPKAKKYGVEKLTPELKLQGIKAKDVVKGKPALCLS